MGIERYFLEGVGSDFQLTDDIPDVVDFNIVEVGKENAKNFEIENQAPHLNTSLISFSRDHLEYLVA